MNGPDIGYLLNRATRRFRLRLADELAASGLTPQQAAALMAIARSDAKVLTPRALAEAIDTDQATVSGLVNRLVRDGWIEITPNPHDRRSRLVSLSSKASEALPDIAGAASAVSAELTACLSAGERAALIDALHRLCVEPAGWRGDAKADS